MIAIYRIGDLCGFCLLIDKSPAFPALKGLCLSQAFCISPTGPHEGIFASIHSDWMKTMTLLQNLEYFFASSTYNIY